MKRDPNRKLQRAPESVAREESNEYKNVGKLGSMRCSSRQRVPGSGGGWSSGKSGLGPTRPNAGLPLPPLVVVVDRLTTSPPSPSASTSTFWLFPISISSPATSSRPSHRAPYNVYSPTSRTHPPSLAFSPPNAPRPILISLACKSAPECAP